MKTMHDIQKRCFIGSIASHVFLMLLVLFGSAFFTAKSRTDPLAAMKVIPSKFIDGLTGGGGNPAIPITSDQQKGDPNATPQVKPPPRPPTPKRVEAVQPQPRVAQPPPPQPAVARIPK